MRTFYRVNFIALIIVIAYIAFLPNYNTLPEFTTLSDIANHFAAFLVLALFFDQGYAPKTRQLFVGLLAYGFFIEAVQHFLPNRAFELLDLVVDMTGVAAYILTLKVYGWLRLRTASAQ